MKKRIIRMIIYVLLLFVCFFVEWQFFIRSDETMTEIVFMKSTLDKGGVISTEDIYYKKLPEKFVTEHMVQKHDLYLEHYVNREVFKDTFLEKDAFQSNPLISLKEDERIITLKCSFVESNGWQSEIYDLVDLILVAQEDLIVLEDVQILKVLSDMSEPNNHSEYYSLIVKSHQATQYYETLNHGKIYVSIKGKR